MVSRTSGSSTTDGMPDACAVMTAPAALTTLVFKNVRLSTESPFKSRTVLEFLVSWELHRSCPIIRLLIYWYKPYRIRVGAGVIAGGGNAHSGHDAEAVRTGS